MVSCAMWLDIIRYYTQRKKNVAVCEKKIHLVAVANSPHSDTVTVSFTLPRALAVALDAAAQVRLTNKSDIIRQALLAYLTPAERDRVMALIVSPTMKAAEDATPYKVKRKRA